MTQEVLARDIAQIAQEYLDYGNKSHITAELLCRYMDFLFAARAVAKKEGDLERDKAIKIQLHKIKPQVKDFLSNGRTVLQQVSYAIEKSEANQPAPSQKLTP